MRGLRSTIALIVVLGGLFAYIYFVTWKKPATDAGDGKEKVFAVQADKIEELKVTSDKGDVTTVKKDGGTWKIVAPIATKADESQISGITSALAGVEVVRVIDENPTDLKDYGLTTPRFAIEFQIAGDKDARRLLVGDKSPTGADLFAKRNDEKRVFLIPAFQESTLDRTTFDLRDKTLLAFERDKVDGIEIDADGKVIQLAKDGSEWKMVKPLQLRADYGAVEGLIGKLQTTQMKSIVANEATPADLKKDGLDKPPVTVSLSMGSARATLALGTKTDDNAVFARDASKALVATVDATLADDLKKGADDYRRKDIFEFRAYNANRVELARNGQTVVFERVKGQGESAQDKWRRVSPNAADVDRDKVEAMLGKLANVRATSFVDSTANTGLNAPALTVAATFEDGKKTEHVTFGKAGSDVYAARPGEPGAAKVDAADLDEVTKSLDELSK